MRILWHMPRLQLSGCGLSQRALRLARELTRAGHRVAFAAPEDKTDLVEARAVEFPLWRYPAHRRRPLHWSLQSLERLRFAADAATHFQSSRHDLFVTCQAEMVLAYRRHGAGAPVVFVCGGSSLLQEPRETSEQRAHSLFARPAFALDRVLRRRMERGAFRAADANVFDSATTRALVVEQYGIPGDNCRAIVGGVDVDEFSPASGVEKAAFRQSLGIAAGQPVVVWTGRLSPEKNVGLLIRAAARCDPRCTLILVGDGPLQLELQELAGAEGIGERTIWAGRVADVRPYLRAADVFAFPSLGESFGGALVEAMACGLPCIALRPDARLVRTANAEIINHGATGWLVDGPSEQAFAAGLESLLADAALRSRLAAGAREKCERAFSWRRAGEELAELVGTVPSRVISAPGSPRDGFPCALPST